MLIFAISLTVLEFISSVKNTLLILLCICCGTLYGQRKPRIKGNKSVVEVSEELPPFTGIELKDDLEINLQKSSDFIGYSITADDNLIDVLKFEVKDSILHISSFYTITGKKQLDISVNYDQLSMINAKDGKIMSEAIISSDEMKISSGGYSRLDLQLTAAVTTVLMEDNSKANLNIDSDSLAVTLKDKIDANLYTVSNIHDLNLQDDAIANIEGTSDSLQIKMSGSSKLKAQKLEGGTVNLETVDATLARIHAYRKLYLSSSGSAKVYLYGDPLIEISSFTDSSELYKRSE